MTWTSGQSGGDIRDDRVRRRSAVTNHVTRYQCVWLPLNQMSLVFHLKKQTGNVWRQTRIVIDAFLNRNSPDLKNPTRARVLNPRFALLRFVKRESQNPNSNSTHSSRRRVLCYCVWITVQGSHTHAHTCTHTHTHTRTRTHTCIRTHTHTHTNTHTHTLTLSAV